MQKSKWYSPEILLSLALLLVLILTGISYWIDTRVIIRTHAMYIVINDNETTAMFGYVNTDNLRDAGYLDAKK